MRIYEVHAIKRHDGQLLPDHQTVYVNTSDMQLAVNMANQILNGTPETVEEGWIITDLDAAFDSQGQTVFGGTP